MKKLFLILLPLVIMAVVSCRHESGYDGVSVPDLQRKWTTVVYMGADNDLEGVALDDLAEMEAASLFLEHSGHTVLALLDRSAGYTASSGDWSDTRLFLMEDGLSCTQIDCPELGLSIESSTELNMASSETLKSLLSFARSSYPAEHYALIIWGHGCGWRGYTIDEQSDAVMSLPALHEAVSGAGIPLSVIGFDCCYGAMLETAYELRNDAEILVATERDEPAAGWNYTYLFQALAEAASASESPEAGCSQAEMYARSAVSAFGRQYAFSEGVSLTALSLEKAESVFDAFEAFSRLCAGCITTRSASVYFATQILPQASTFLTGEYPAYSFVDIAELADCFQEGCIPDCSTACMEAAAEAAETLLGKLNEAVVVSFTGGSGAERGLSGKPMLAVYHATVEQGGVIMPDYPQLYIRGSGVAGQSAFVRDSTGWVPQHLVSQSISLLDTLYRKPLP